MQTINQNVPKNVPEGHFSLNAEQSSEARAFLQENTLSPQEERLFRAYARFLLWLNQFPAMLKQVKFNARLIELPLLASSRFSYRDNRDGILEMQVFTNEMDWIIDLPIRYVGVHFKSKMIFLVCTPSTKISENIIGIKIDILEKMMLFKGRDRIIIQESDLLGKPARKIRLDLIEINDIMYQKKKRKFKR